MASVRRSTKIIDLMELPLRLVRGLPLATVPLRSVRGLPLAMVPLRSVRGLPLATVPLRSAREPRSATSQSRYVFPPELHLSHLGRDLSSLSFLPPVQRLPTRLDLFGLAHPCPPRAL